MVGVTVEKSYVCESLFVKKLIKSTSFNFSCENLMVHQCSTVDDFRYSYDLSTEECIRIGRRVSFLISLVLRMKMSILLLMSLTNEKLFKNSH